MYVETDRSGTELVAFAGTTLMLLSGALPWVKGGTRLLPTTAAVTVLCGVAAGAVLLYGNGRAADYAAFAGLGTTVGLLAIRAHGRFTTSGGFASTGSSPDIGVFAAGIAGIALAAAGAHECWMRVTTSAGAEPTNPARSD